VGHVGGSRGDATYGRQWGSFCGHVGGSRGDATYGRQWGSFCGHVGGSSFHSTSVRAASFHGIRVSQPRGWLSCTVGRYFEGSRDASRMKADYTGHKCEHVRVCAWDYFFSGCAGSHVATGARAAEKGHLFSGSTSKAPLVIFLLPCRLLSRNRSQAANVFEKQTSQYRPAPPSSRLHVLIFNFECKSVAISAQAAPRSRLNIHCEGRAP